MALVMLGWSPRFSHWLKGTIRKTLMLGSRPVPVKFKRRLECEDDKVIVTSVLKIEKKVQFKALAIGGEFFVRYVPQSRFFQNQEVRIQPVEVSNQLIESLNKGLQLEIVQPWDYSQQRLEVEVNVVGGR